MNFLRRLLQRKPRPDIGEPPSNRPSDWNLTISELIEEIKTGKRPTNPQELWWAREYELSLIPDGMRRPRSGDVYESLIDQNVTFLTAWHAPVTLSGEGTLQKGERIWIKDDPMDEKPIGVSALPVEREEMEKRMVPESDRDDPKYAGFYFFFKTVELNQKFKLVETGYTGNEPPPAATN